MMPYYKEQGEEQEERKHVERLKRAKQDFCRLARIKLDEKHDLIYAHDPDMILALSRLIEAIVTKRLKPVRCMVEAHEESGTPVTAFTIELADFGD